MKLFDYNVIPKLKTGDTKKACNLVMDATGNTIIGVKGDFEVKDDNIGNKSYFLIDDKIIIQ